MKKRIFSLLLAVCVLVSMVPCMGITADAAATLYWPVPGHTSLSRGYSTDHPAMDISDGSINGATIVAAMGGTVYKVYTCTTQHYGDLHTCGGFGTGVIIKGDDDRWYQYAHMQAGSIPGYVYADAYISAGTMIGKVGTTGNSSGPHLHFGISNGSSWHPSNVDPAGESYIYTTPEISVTFGDSSRTTIGDTSATLAAILTVSGASISAVSHVGIELYNPDGSLLASKQEVPQTTGSYIDMFYYTDNSELGVTLTQGTTYTYRFLAVIGGQTYYSDTRSFTTTGHSHSYGGWTVTTAPGCTTEGVETRTCSCGASETRAIPAAGHSWQQSGFIPGTCQTPGTVTYTCAGCGGSYSETADTAWSDWSETYPAGIPADRIETKTEYRYRDYVTFTSKEPDMPGYDLLGSEWQQSGSGTLDYVASWPAGFSTGHSLYAQYNKTPLTNSETATTKTVINSSATAGYLVWHWCRGTYTAGPINRTISDTYTSTYCTFHAFHSTNNGSNTTPDGNDGGGTHVRYYPNSAVCTDAYWFFAADVTRQSYTTYDKLFTYGQWSDWSGWSEAPAAGSDTRQVESRTLYRYSTALSGDHEWDGGSVSTDPTCTADGLRTYTCALCGETRTETIAALGHDYVGGSCTRCGDMPVTISVSTVEAAPGDTVTVPVTIANNDGFAGFTLSVAYDDALTLTGITMGELLQTSDSGSFSKNVSDGLFTWFDIADITADGVLVDLTFRVSDDAADGSYPVSVALRDGLASNFVDENAENVPVSMVPGAVLVDTRAAQIASGWSGDLTWVLTDDGTLTFSGSGKMKNYEYKSEMPWYSYRDRISTVILEEGVTSIGDYAFYGMPALRSITIAGTVTAIGDYAFKNCPVLDGVRLPAGLTQLGDSAFYACASLTAIDIPAKLYTVKPYTFKNCTALATVTFHEGNLQKISDGAFYNTALKSLELPDCLDILDVYAFKNCAKLTSIHLSASLTQIREAVFYGTAIPTITIPEGVTKIGPYAFKNCVKLETIGLPESLTSVGEASFYACTALESLDLPDSVASIGNYAFRKCAALAEVSLGSSLKTIGESSFYGCEGLIYLEIPDAVTTIEGYAFKGCSNLEFADLSAGLTTLGDSAFHSCTSLSEIIIPAKVATIGAYCLSGSTDIRTITFEGSAPSIGSGAFNKITATAYYPSGDATWTAAVRQNYGGSITWMAQ